MLKTTSSAARLFWLSVATAGLLLTAWLGPGLMYAKLQSDSSIYLLQAKILWETGTAWNFSIADGLPNLVYTPIPAYIRAPLFIFDNTGMALTLLVQLQNISILTILAWTSQRYLEIRLPKNTSSAWPAAPWILISLTYQPWLLNVFMPLGDHLFALLSMGTLVLFLEADRQTESSMAKSMAYSGHIMTAVAVIMKSTAIGLFMYALLLFGKKSHPMRRTLPLGGAIVISTLTIYSQLHGQVLSTGIKHYLTHKSPQDVLADTLTNLTFAALPNQIIPNFSYLLGRDFTSTHAYLASSISLDHTIWLAIGFLITSAIGIGAWRSRHQNLPELILLSVNIPLYALATNSTARYLASIQPIFWLFLLSSHTQFEAMLKRHRQKILIATISIILIALPKLTTNMSRSFSALTNTTIGSMPDFLHQLAETFEKGNRTLITVLNNHSNSKIVITNNDSRWAVLASAKFIAVNQAGNAACSGTTLFTVFACDARNCSRLKKDYHQVSAQLHNQGLVLKNVIHLENPASTFDVDHWQPTLSGCKLTEASKINGQHE